MLALGGRRVQAGLSLGRDLAGTGSTALARTGRPFGHGYLRSIGPLRELGPHERRVAAEVFRRDDTGGSRLDDGRGLPASTDGRGLKTRRAGGARGRSATRATRSRPGDLPVRSSCTRTRWRATCHCTTRSARTSPPPGSSRSRRRIAAVRANGGFATTRYGVLGSGSVSEVGVQHDDVRGRVEPLRQAVHQRRRRARSRAPTPRGLRARP